MSTSDYIDALLEQYLDLLHQYTSLRNELNNLQSSLYHHISRANFSAERGIRYGQDFYDERMQASTTLEVSTSASDEVYKFSVIDEQTAQKQHLEQTSRNEEDTYNSETLDNLEQSEDDEKDETASPAEKKEDSKAKPPKTPLSWFGILTAGAPSLRSAQAASAAMTSRIIPKIASLDCEMKELEIRIRRARKFRAKAEAEILKQEKIQG